MSPAHSGIQALIELARRDRVEMRPVLLRVLTDLYVQESSHAPAERARFAELACRLLDGAETATRAAVAERLASYAGAPPSVIAKLARDDISVASPVLRRSPSLSEAELHSILDTCGIAHAVAIAARTDLPESIRRRLRDAGAAADEAAKPEPLPDTDPGVTLVLARRYLVADPGERRTILKALALCPPLPDEERFGQLGRGLQEKLERAALRQRTAEFLSLLRDHLGMQQTVTARIVEDASGEPLAALCRALGMPFATAARILLFLNPAVGASVQQVSALASDYDGMPAANVRRLAAAWCEIGGALRPERSKWTRTRRERIDPRPAAVRALRGVTPAQPARASES